MSDHLDHIDELQKRLYTRDPEQVPKRKFGILHPVKQKTQSAWGATEIPKEKLEHPKGGKGYKRFFIIAILFFIFALGVALFSFYRGAVTLSSKNVDVMILGNSFVGGGEELPIQVEIANRNSTDLVNAHLTLNYPKGATDETGADVVRIERDLGVIPSGKTRSEEFTAVLYGEQGISRSVTAILTYQLNGSSAKFQKESVFSVMVNSSPVGLTVDVPSGVVSNQPFTLTIRNIFSGDKLLNNVVTRVEYPNGFVFQSATPKPTAGTNVWNLGDLQKGDERTIVIQGKIIGEVGDEKAFRTYVGVPEDAGSNKIAVAYNSTLRTLRIGNPFIAAAISVDGKRDDIIPLTIGDEVEGVVSWINNSGLTITNPTFTLYFNGAPIDAASIFAPYSYYNQLEHTITWTPDSDSTITTIEPGESGDFVFGFTPQDTQTSRDITLGLSIKGSFPERDNLEQSIDTIDQKTIKFGSTINFTAQSMYSIGPIKNTGPYSPKADADTTYTVTWTVAPSQNILTNTIATATLPGGVNWTGTIAPLGESVTYNSDTKTVTWNIGPLPKATATPKNKSISFQVKVRPTKTQVGETLDLLGPTTVTATDAVTQTTVSTTTSSLTTKFDTDPIYIIGADRVVP